MDISNRLAISIPKFSTKELYRPHFSGIGSITSMDTLQTNETVQSDTLLNLTPAQKKYISEIRDIISPYGVKEVQQWDETKIPPLDILKGFTSRGIFVSGVPLPSVKKATRYLNNPDFLKAIGSKNVERLQNLKDMDGTQSAKLLKQIQMEGATKAMAVASIEIPRKTSVGVGTFLGVNNGLSAQVLSKIGTPEQQALWLNALNQGVFTYAFGLTEEKVGSDPRSIQTTFKKETDENGQVVYRLNGNKKFIGNAARALDTQGNVVHRGADFIEVFAVDDPKKAPADRSYRVFMVPRQSIGEENIHASGYAHNKMGLKEVNNGDFILQDVIVPESLLIGKPDEDIYKKMLGLLDITRLFVGAMGVGEAEACIEAAKHYAGIRQQNGSVIDKFQGVSFPLKMLEAKVEVGKLLVMESAKMVDEAMRQQTTQEILSPLRENISALLSDKTLDRDSTGLTLQNAIEKLKEFSKEQPFSILQQQLQSLNNTMEEITDTEIQKQLDEIHAQIDKIQDPKQKPIRFGLETAITKLFGSELAEEAAYFAINTLGGNGFIEAPEQGLGLPKRYRDSKVLTIYEGTSNIQRNIIAQGTFAAELFKAKKNPLRGLRLLLLQAPLKKTFYRLTKETSFSPMARANAAFNFAFADVVSRCKKELNQLKEDWAKDGIPDQYKNWDEKSIERQQAMVASLPVQARLFILADIAVYRKLLQLATAQIEVLHKKSSLTAEEQKQLQNLQLFERMADDHIIAKGRHMGSQTLAGLEQEYLAGLEKS